MIVVFVVVCVYHIVQVYLCFYSSCDFSNKNAKRMCNVVVTFFFYEKCQDKNDNNKNSTERTVDWSNDRIWYVGRDVKIDATIEGETNNNKQKQPPRKNAAWNFTSTQNNGQTNRLSCIAIKYNNNTTNSHMEQRNKNCNHIFAKLYWTQTMLMEYFSRFSCVMLEIFVLSVRQRSTSLAKSLLNQHSLTVHCHRCCARSTST